MPHKYSVPLNWRLQKGRYALAGSACSCGKMYLPAKGVCVCGKTTQGVTFSDRGVVESFTVIHAAPEGFESQSPYVIGIIRLKGGPALTAQIAENGDKVRIGSTVRSVFRRIYSNENDQIIYGTKFVFDD